MEGMNFLGNDVMRSETETSEKLITANSYSEMFDVSSILLNYIYLKYLYYLIFFTHLETIGKRL